MTSNCWICGSPTTSAEHMVKASDFRTIFGNVTHTSPVYRQSKGDLNRPIRGASVAGLKFKPSLCAPCNNARTQPYDRAWERFLSYMRDVRPLLRCGNPIRFKRIFSQTSAHCATNLHLYFLKQLGCHAVESNIPLPVTEFAACILSGHPHPCLRLIFVDCQFGASRYKIQVGDVQTLNRGQKTVSAVTHYRVESVGVVLSYVEPGHIRLTKDRGWHPSDPSGPRMA